MGRLRLVVTLSSTLVLGLIACNAFDADSGGAPATEADSATPINSSTGVDGQVPSAPDATANAADDAEAGGPGGRRAVQCRDDAGTCTGAAACCLSEHDQDKCLDVCRQGDLAIYCNDTTDCNAGEFCCAEKEPNGQYTIVVVNCRPSCASSPTTNRVCNPGDTSECGPGRACVNLSAAFGADLYARNYQLYGCK